MFEDESLLTVVNEMRIGKEMPSSMLILKNMNVMLAAIEGACNGRQGRGHGAAHDRGGRRDVDRAQQVRHKGALNEGRPSAFGEGYHACFCNASNWVCSCTVLHARSSFSTAAKRTLDLPFEAVR